MSDWEWTESWHDRALDRVNNPESGPILLRRDLGYALHEIERLRVVLAATSAEGRGMDDADAHRALLADGWTYIEYGRLGQTIVLYTCPTRPCVRHGVGRSPKLTTHQGKGQHADPVEARRLARKAATEGREP